MDIASLLGTMLSANSVSSMGQTTNVSQQNVQSVLGAALPSLLSGALNQANDSSTAASFAGALTQHSAADTSNLGNFMNNVDMENGAKIVAHLLGSNSSAVVSQIAQQSGVSKQDTAKVLSAAAPLLMSLLGQETNQQLQSNSSAGVSNIMGSLLQNADMGSILSGLLGASGSAATTASSNKKDDGLLGALFNLLK